MVDRTKALFHRKKILVVEDSAIQRELLKRSLQQAGFQVSLAKNGTEGLHSAQEHAPDLIITDIAMPEMDGYEMCLNIKNDERLRHIPVILLTALSDTKEIIRGLRAEADNYITKPYDEEYLLLRVGSLLESPVPKEEVCRDQELQVDYFGETYCIKSKPMQILNLLLSTYENAVQKNKALIDTQFELKTLNEELEEKVRERTKELQASEESYRALLENTFSGFYRFSTTGKFLSLNPAFCSMLGYSCKDELMAFTMDIPSLFFRHSDYLKFMAALKENKAVREFVSHLKKKDGSEVIIEQNIRIVLSEEGEALYYEGFVNDITECKRVEEQLIKLSSAIVQSPVSIIITDMKGTIEFVNPKFIETTGYLREEVIGKTPAILKSGKTSREVYDDMWETLAGGAIWRGEFLNRRKNGELYWDDTTISPIKNPEGIITHYLAVKEDITVRRNMEEALKTAKEAAEVANRAKSEFLANMSHEIRTPMNAVIGMTDLVLDTELSPDQREYLEIVKQAADSLLAILNSILDFSKIEAGRLELETTYFDLRTVIENVCETLAIQAQKKGLELFCHIKPDVPTRLYGDPVRLSQILVNLAGNAIKFTEVGEIVIRVEMENNSLHGDSVMPVFSVSDMGIGIPKSKLDYIFESFSQADGSTTRKYGGTGLGLAISRQLAHLMGGAMWVDSDEGIGSTFYFTAQFGLKPADRTAAPPKSTLLEEKPFLVVSNFPTSSLVLQDMLAGLGGKLHAVETLKEGMEELRQARERSQPYQVVFIDCRLSGGGGFALAEQMKNDPSCKEHIIMMLNSSHRSGDLERCKELCLSSYVIKPIRQCALLNAVIKILDLPIEECTNETGKETAVSTEESAKPLRILLVEDNAFNRILAVKIFHKYGCQVMEAEDGTVALKLLEDNSYDMIFMDVQMPEMDGFETTKRIRTSAGLAVDASIPIIAMTAHALKGDRERCIEAGMDDYLTKPLKVADLAAMIDQYNPYRATTDSNRKDNSQKPARPDKRDKTERPEREPAQPPPQGRPVQAPKPAEAPSADNLKAFLREAPACLEMLQESIDGREYTVAEMQAGKLKKAAEKAGLVTIKNEAFRIMLASRKDDKEGALAHLSKLRGEISLVTAGSFDQQSTD